MRACRKCGACGGRLASPNGTNPRPDALFVGERDVLSQTTLPQVKMPNRDGFVPDPRPDTGRKP